MEGMNTKSIIMSVVAIAVAVLVVVTCAIPIFTSATETERTFTNEGYFYLDKFTDEYSFYWDSAEPTKFIINGDEEVTFTNTSGLAISLVLGQNFAVRFPSGNTNVSFYGAGTYVSTSADNPTFTLTYADGSVTATNGTNTKVVSSVTEIYGMVENGPYTMKKSTDTVYLNSGSEVIADSEIYASGQTFNGNNYIWWHMEGTIDDMDYPEVFNDTFTVTNKQINGQYNNTYDDLYELNNIQFTVTASNSIVYNVTASYFVVPYEVTAEKTIHPTDIQITLISIIPILMVLGIIVAAVGMFLRSRT